MYVTRTHHRRVVTLLSIALVSVIALFVMSVFGTNNLVVTSDNVPSAKKVETGAENLAAVGKQFLKEEEGVLVPAVSEKGGSEGEPEEKVLPVVRVLFQYVEVNQGCGVHFQGDCVNVRSGPGTDFPVVERLRNNVILKVDGLVERQGRNWYRVVFDEWLRYPERVEGEWFIASDYVRVLLNEGNLTVWADGKATTSKRIIVDRSDQKLYAYDGDELFMEEDISTGLELTPTPAGEFTVFKKTPSRYMQGPIPGIPDEANDEYDLPGVPWNLYFTHQGAVIHGAYWHDSFGQPYSHGCVNMHPNAAQKLYQWAVLGTKVIVRQ